MPSATERSRNMTQGTKYVSAKTLEAIEKALAHGDRVELIPVKDGVKVIRIRRDEIK